MFKSIGTLTQNVINDISVAIERYSPAVIALIALIELVWIASVLVPVLYVLSTFIDFLKIWMTILPGFWGMTTFFLILMVGGFVAYLPSTYVARWREHMIEKIARRHPSPVDAEQFTPVPAAFPTRADMQGSD
jgi:hypothetical protein